MTVWFTSDLHFNHANIIRYCDRPWPNVLDMNEGLVERWNSVVGEHDTVWVLGDLVMGQTQRAAPWLRELRGDRKFLVPGNHDAVWPHHKKPKPRTDVERYGFQVWPTRVLIDAPRPASTLAPIELNHFPFVTTFPGDARFAGHLPRDEGQWLLHGHVHESWKIRDRMINVGVDVWNYTPVSMQQILDIIG